MTKAIIEDGNLESRHRACLEMLRERGQEHVLRWWPVLTPAQREQLLCDIESIPWKILDGVIGSHVVRRPDLPVTADLAPAPVYPKSPGPGLEPTYHEAAVRGRELLSAGKVAAFTVAGGQGTRLGVDGPKGAVVVTPFLSDMGHVLHLSR